MCFERVSLHGLPCGYVTIENDLSGDGSFFLFSRLCLVLETLFPLGRLYINFLSLAFCQNYPKPLRFVIKEIMGVTVMQLLAW